MKYEEIQELLERYFEGETSLDEERSIKAYFHAGRIDDRLSAIAPMFQAIREEQSVQLATKAAKVSIRPQLYQWAVAASVALLLGAGWWMLQEEKQTQVAAEIKPVETTQTLGAPEAPKAQESIAQVEKMAPISKVIRKKTTAKRPKPSIDPETAQAMAEIKAALALVSAKLDKGRNEAVRGATLLEAIEKVPKRKAG